MKGGALVVSKTWNDSSGETKESMQQLEKEHKETANGLIHTCCDPT